MRAVSYHGLVVVLLLLLTGCNESTGVRSPLLIGDTITVAAPLPQNASQPHALDITSSFGIRGGRFPELARDALEWDFAVRIQGDQLVLVPAGMLGVEHRSEPAITAAIPGATIGSLIEAPGQSTFLRDQAVPMVVGAIYAARSREFAMSDPFYGGLVSCTQFAKMEPVEVDVAAGILRIYIVTNENCSDLRLAPAD